jgi:methyl-accepting chemotaxis protein
MMNKLRNKLLLAMLLVTLLPLFLVGGYSLYSTTDSLRQNSLSNLQNEVSLVTERVENFLKNVSSDLFYLSDSSAVNLYLSGLKGDEESSQLLLDNLAGNLRVFSDKRVIYQQIRFINTKGMEVVRIDYKGGKAKIISKDKLQNKKDHYYFADAIKLKKNELMVSRLDLNRENGQIESPINPVLRYATPIFNEINELQGIIILNVQAQKFLNIIGKAQLSNETLVFVDKEGHYYQHPDPAKSWGAKADKNTGINLFIEKPSIEKSVVKSSNAGNFETDDEIAYYKPVLLNHGQQQLGTIINFVPKDVVFAPVTLFLWVFLGILVFSLFIAFLLASLFSASISNPLVTLKSEVERLAKGDLDSSIDVETNDEIGDLSLAIEKLRRSMQILMKRAAR